MNRSDFQTLADLRIAEAESLLQNGFFEGAYYLAGYAVEFGLKACIARLTNQYDFPAKNTQRDHYTHDFEILLKTAKLGVRFEVERKSRPGLEASWLIVKRWKEESRYHSKGATTQVEVESLIKALTDSSFGVLTWIKRFW